MSFQFNSFRPRKYIRSRFLDGKYLLSQEATDIQLELFEYTREIVSNLFGDTSVGDAWLVQPVPSSLGISNYQNKVIVRPGEAYYNGLPFFMVSGEDPRVGASASQPVTLGTPNDPGGKILDFTSLPSGYYKIIVEAQEEEVTPLEDTFLQGAAVPESTEEKRRINYTLTPVPCDVNGNLAPLTNTVGNTSGTDPLNFATTNSLNPTQLSQFYSYNDLFKVFVSANSVVPTSDDLGSTQVVTFDNSAGVFPTGPLMGEIFTGGFLIDPDGSFFYITAVQVSTFPNQISFTISQELAVPAGTGYAPVPNFATLGLQYSLIPADVISENPSTGIPLGTRNYPISIVYWNGSNISSTPFGISSSQGNNLYNIEDLRKNSPKDNLASVSDKENYVLTGGGTAMWTLATQILSWTSAYIIEDPTDPTLSFIIPPGDTMSLFGSVFAEDEVLYFIIPKDASGATTVLLQKDARGTNDLERYPTEDMIIFAYRKNNQIYSPHSGLTLVSPAYDERILYPSGLAANTPITLPLNSRNANIAETYDPINGNLQVFMNQLFKYQDVGTPGDGDWYSVSSTQIAFNYALPANAEVHFRMESVNGWSTGSGGGGGGGVTSLNGGTGPINLIAGPNITIGPVIAGDIEISASGGGGSGTYFQATLLNMSGGDIPANSPVYMSAPGQISIANCTNTPPAASRVIGVTTADIPNTMSGPVIYGGYAAGVATGLLHGAYAYLSAVGTLTFVPPVTPGQELIIIGVVNGNDLFMQIQNLGTL